MCGITGILYFDKSRKVNPALLKDMCAVIQHRGPDDGGIWVQGSVGLGFRRLSIIDLSAAGHQPMCNEDASVWIIFNGEIYNFLDLRTELVQKGHVFRSHTDTETILHLWEEEGEHCVQRLQGMFAFAIWDSRSQTLFMARDRMGKKPLCYAKLPDRLVFGSEIKSILQDPDLKSEPDLEALHHYLAFQSVPSPYSAFKGIQKLPPAHILICRNGKIRVQRYWKLSYDKKRRVDTPQQEAALQEELIERLREAIRLRLISDVPLGAFLSGGIDSSIVVALMAGMGEQPVKTFSIGFENEEFNELPYARMVAERYRTEHHEFVVTPDAQAIFPDLVWHYNEPFADSSAIPTYYVSKLARDYVTVVLTGDGGDENFAGYTRYLPDTSYANQSRFKSLIARLLRKNPALLPFYDSNNLFKTWQRLYSLDSEHWLYYMRITHFHEAYQHHLYTKDFRERLGNSYTVDWMLDIYRRSDAHNFLDATLDVDLNMYLPDTLMTKVDVASMAHSLEARAPMLDHKFLEFAATIPANLKLRDGVVGKYILKKAVEPYLPHELIHRKKMGFGVPIDHWFRNELKEMAYDILLGSKAMGRGYFNRKYIESLLDRHQKGETWQYPIWNLLMLEMWHLMFIDKSMDPPNRI
jgi:asparagine synthase (glutamine-hydrolysing)